MSIPMHSAYPSPTKDGLPRLHCLTEADWDQWLDENFSTSAGVWLMIAKKGGDHSSVTYSQAVDTGLCHGWIDGQKGTLDTHFFVQRFTPRRPRSKWSQINRDKVAAMQAAGRMRPAGLAEVDAAKADGRWDAAYAPHSQMVVPDDLAEAVAKVPEAQAFFEALNRTNLFAMIYRVNEAKRPETRARRIAQFVEMLARGEKLH